MISLLFLALEARQGSLNLLLIDREKRSTPMYKENQVKKEQQQNSLNLKIYLKPELLGKYRRFYAN